MSDPITCPECEGRKGERLGDLFLACRFCGGLGWVGGQHEPAERGGEQPPDGPPPAWKHKVWQDPYVASQLGCRYCLGSKRVARVDEQSGTIVTLPCLCTVPV